MGIGKIDPEYAVREGWARDSDDEIYMDGYNAFIQITTRDGTSGFQVKNDIGAVVFSSKSDGDGYVAQRMGIGIYNPSNELEVAGVTQTTQLKVTYGAHDGYVLIADPIGLSNWNPVSNLSEDIVHSETIGSGSKPHPTIDNLLDEHSEAIIIIRKDLDGYHPDITGQEHYRQLSDAVQTIIKSLDGYGGASQDVKVKVSSDDTTAGYLYDKVVSGHGISLSIDNAGGNEKLRISSSIQLDGYASDQTVSEHYTQHSQAIQDIIGSLDGYTSPIVTDYIRGLKISYNNAYQIKISTGTCSDDGNTETITNSSELTIDITSSGANGLDTGSEASSTWYYVWVIKNITTGTVAGLLSTSSTSPTMPSGYTKKRRVGTVRNDSSSNFLKYYMTGKGSLREYTYDDYTITTVLNNGTAMTWTDVDCSAFVPSTSTYLMLYAITVNVADSYCAMTFRPNGSSSTSQISLHGYIETSGSIVCNTDSSQNIEYTNSTSDTWSYLYVIGYKEEL